MQGQATHRIELRASANDPSASVVFLDGYEAGIVYEPRHPGDLYCFVSRMTKNNIPLSADARRIRDRLRDVLVSGRR